MKFTIEKGLLHKTINFFYDLPLKGKQSRHRSKFVKLLKVHFQEFAEDEKALLEEHAERDESGKIQTGENGNGYKIADKRSFLMDKAELFGEKIVIDGGEYEETLKTVARILEEYDGELTGNDAELYDILASEFEESA